jgi:hypothetical protein
MISIRLLKNRNLIRPACDQRVVDHQGAAHVDLHNAAKIEYEHRLLEFFSKHLR